MKTNHPDRRKILKHTAVTAGLLGGLGNLHAASDVIGEENKKEGTTDWHLDKVGRDTSAIQGYASKQSVLAGEKIALMVSTNPVSEFKIELFRTGYYGGRGARKVHEIGPLKGKSQAIPKPSQGDKRLIECRWEAAVELKIPEDWVSGVYLARLTTIPAGNDPSDYRQNYIIFIVKDERPCDLLVQCSDNTWQAYNAWEGCSLYKHPKGNQRALAHVSFDRPYAKYPQGFMPNMQSTGSGEWLCFEFPMAYWLEREGYDISYCSNSDLLVPDRALKCKGFVSVGHDEYWDIRQHDSIATIRDQGVSLLFFSANTCCWVSPMMPSSSGQPNRITYRGGPYGAKQSYAEFREKKYGPYPHRGPDEGLLLGARNIHSVLGHGDWACNLPDHWMFDGTGMKKGDSVQGLVGWELHGQAATEISGLEIIGTGTAWDREEEKAYTATVYPGPKENFVFNAATIYWSQGLSSPPRHVLPRPKRKPILGPDPRVEKMTRNLVERAIRS